MASLIVATITWITEVILVLIHANEILFRDERNASIRSKPNGGGRFALRPSFVLVTLNNFMMISWSSSTGDAFQMSALSTVDSRFCAYHGCNKESGFYSGDGA